MKDLRTCRKCHVRYDLKPGKPGFIYHCPECSDDPVDLLGGNMIYTHKTAPEIEIKPLGEAQHFARLTRRLGAGVTASITTGKEQAFRQLKGVSAFADSSDADVW